MSSLPARLKALVDRAVRGARTYAHVNEQANHADQLDETRASLRHMAREEADPEISPERRHWLNEHRAGMENRLAVLAQAPRLTVEQMNERDAIETHLYGAPLPRGSQRLVARVNAARQGFLGAVGGIGLWQYATLGASALALLGWGGAWLTGARLDHAKQDLANARADVAALTDQLSQAREVSAQLADNVRAADAQTRQTAETIETERARRVRTERELRRIRDAEDAVRAGSAIDYGFGSVRDDRPAGAGGDNSSSTADPG